MNNLATLERPTVNMRDLQIKINVRQAAQDASDYICSRNGIEFDELIDDRLIDNHEKLNALIHNMAVIQLPEFPKMSAAELADYKDHCFAIVKELSSNYSVELSRVIEDKNLLGDM